jgi:hypothetical protein
VGKNFAVLDIFLWDIYRVSPQIQISKKYIGIDQGIVRGKYIKDGKVLAHFWLR